MQNTEPQTKQPAIKVWETERVKEDESMYVFIFFQQKQVITTVI